MSSALGWTMNQGGGSGLGAKGCGAESCVCPAEPRGGAEHGAFLTQLEGVPVGSHGL